MNAEEQAVFDKMMARATAGQQRISAMIPDELLVAIDAKVPLTIEQLADLMLAAWLDGTAHSGEPKHG